MNPIDDRQRLGQLLERALGKAVRVDASEAIPAGWTNRVYRVHSGAVRYVVRLVHDADAVDRPRERKTLAAAARAGLAPSPLHLDDAGNAVYRDLALATLAEALPAGGRVSPTLLRGLAATLRRLHALPRVTSRRHHPAASALASLQQARARGWPLDPAMLELAAALAREPLDGRVLCHNDLNPTNILLGQRIWILDWESAALGDPLQDLVNLAEGMGLDDDDLHRLVDAYGLPSPTPERLRTLRRMHHLGEYAWAVAQLAGGRIHGGIRAQMEQAAARLRRLA